MATLKHHAPAKDRRRALRHPCNWPARVKRLGDGFWVTARVSDVSRHGCYLETMSPFPVGTELHITLYVERFQISAVAVTRTSHPAMGYGVEFTTMDPDSAQRLEELIESLTLPAPAPVSEAASRREPHAMPSPNLDEPASVPVEVQFQALLKLLAQKSIVSETEWEEQIRKLSQHLPQP